MTSTTPAPNTGTLRARALQTAGAVLALSGLAVGTSLAREPDLDDGALDDIVLEAAAAGDVTLLPEEAPVAARIAVLDANLVDTVDARLTKHTIAAADRAFVAEVDAVVTDDVDARLAAADTALVESVDATYAEQREAADAARLAAEQAEREAAEKAAREAAEQAAAQAAAAPAVSGGGVWDRLAQCESSGQWAYNGGSGYDGGLQFHPSTWSAYAPSGYPAYAYQASREQQIAVAEQVLAQQGWGAWPACSAKLGLR